MAKKERAEVEPEAEDQTEDTSEEDGMTDNQKLRKAYGAAGTRLREAHREEFNKYQQEEAAKLGVEWTPRPSGVDRARAEMERILEENPELVGPLTKMLVERDQQERESQESA